MPGNSSTLPAAGKTGGSCFFKKKGFAVENAGQLLKIKKHPIQQFSWPVPEAKSSCHSFRPSIIDLVLNSRAGRATGPVLGRA